MILRLPYIRKVTLYLLSYYFNVTKKLLFIAKFNNSFSHKIIFSSKSKNKLKLSIFKIFIISFDFIFYEYLNSIFLMSVIIQTNI